MFHLFTWSWVYGAGNGDGADFFWESSNDVFFIVKSAGFSGSLAIFYEANKTINIMAVFTSKCRIFPW